MDRFDEKRIITAQNALKKIPGPGGEHSVDLFRHGSLEVKVYHPMGSDLQAPHDRDEIYVVMKGHGIFTVSAERQPCAPGDFLFVPAGAEHRFEEFTDDFTVWVFFYGPVGGERTA